MFYFKYTNKALIYNKGLNTATKDFDGWMRVPAAPDSGSVPFRAKKQIAVINDILNISLTCLDHFVKPGMLFMYWLYDKE